MEKRKLTIADIDTIRNVEGFPLAKDERIIEVSDAPYFTACPNPFIGDFISENGVPYDEESDEYHKEPFASDVSEGKNSAIYGAHNYHTKVPPKAIMRYILHYTSPGDIVLDGFSGTGMTGVAAQLCGSNDPELMAQMKMEMPYIKWGKRRAVLNDLAPIASFIAYNQNKKIDVQEYLNAASEVLENSEQEYEWCYETNHIVDGKKYTAKINYTVWSDVFICPHCGEELVFTKVTSGEEKSLKGAFSCSKCGMKLTKNNCERAKVTVYDGFLNKNFDFSKQVPVLINYTFNGKKMEKEPDEDDLSLINKIEEMKIPYSIPIVKMQDGYNTDQPRKSHGIEYLHHFYTKRNLYAISVIYEKLKNYDTPLKQTLMFTFDQILMGMAKIARYVPTHYSQVNQYLSGTLYIGSQVVEVTPEYILNNKIKNVAKALSSVESTGDDVIVSTGSTTNLLVKDSSIDYIFTDPPFGANLNYSELSFLWEGWMNVLTNAKTEAIMNPVQKKGLPEYQDLMTRCFEEYYRVLKPNRWMTVEFHNSQNAVWNAIQEALQRAGFVVADVRSLDKKQGSFKQIVSSKAVKQDLVISVYKPKNSFKKELMEKAGSEETVWAFVQQHLENIPVVVVKNEKIEIIAEREAYLLFDRMVAYHLMNGIPVPIDANKFYQGLEERFLSRDNMYFLPDQVNEYDNARIVNDVEPMQMELFVTNEKSAIAWLYKELETPQTYAEIQPKFMQESKTVDKYESIPELATLLEENFIQDESGKWYVPDITKEGDIAKLREKKLIKEFEGYLATKGKLKVFRSEAIRVGFAKLWNEKNYKLIVETAERLPESIIQEDDKLLMYYDLSAGRV